MFKTVSKQFFHKFTSSSSSQLSFAMCIVPYFLTCDKPHNSSRRVQVHLKRTMTIVLHSSLVVVYYNIYTISMKKKNFTQSTVKRDENIRHTFCCVSADNIPSRVCALVICRSQSVALRRSRPIICFLSSLRVICSPSKVTVL